MVENNKKFYFGKSNQKLLYKELKKSPNLEIPSSTYEYVWPRISGKAVFADDLSIKQKFIDNNELIQSLFKIADNPTLKYFQLKEKHLFPIFLEKLQENLIFSKIIIFYTIL